MRETSTTFQWCDFLKHNRGLLLTGIIFLIMGIWTDITFISKSLSVFFYLTNLIPGILLLSIWYLAFKYPNNQDLIINLGVPCTLLVSLFIFLFNVKSGVFTATGAIGQITDITRYAEIREQMGDSELARHFPMSIPEIAQNAKFEYAPGFLQGGETFQLRMNLPQSEIDNLFKEFRTKATHRFIGGETNDHQNMPDGVPTTFFYTGDTDDQSFSDDYEIMVLNAEPEGTPDFQWNHGFSYGVAISHEKSEIVYWSEYW